MIALGEFTNDRDPDLYSPGWSVFKGRKDGDGRPTARASHIAF